jgi:plastocyanin domain-containing protein
VKQIIAIFTIALCLGVPTLGAVQIDIGKLEKGEIRFACGMGMVSGQIIVH